MSTLIESKLSLTDKGGQTMKKVEVCKYCGKEYVPNGNRANTCGSCDHKVPLLQDFVKARDDLREKLGLERMGKQKL